MTAKTLGTCLGLTIIGYSPDKAASMGSQPHQTAAVIEALLSLPSDYWANLLESEASTVGGGGSGHFPPVHTPDNHPDSRPFAMPSALKSVGPVARRTRSRQLARQKFFESPMLF